jgi:hypothetical protein
MNFLDPMNLKKTQENATLEHLNEARKKYNNLMSDTKGIFRFNLSVEFLQNSY